MQNYPRDKRLMLTFFLILLLVFENALPFHWISDPLMLSCKGKKRVFSDALVPNLVGWALSDVVWVVSSVRKSIRVFLIQTIDGFGCC